MWSLVLTACTIMLRDTPVIFLPFSRESVKNTVAMTFPIADTDFSLLRNTSTASTEALIERWNHE